MNKQSGSLFFIFLMLFANGFGQINTEVKTCSCFKGIGSTEKDEPLFTFEFSNHESVSFCGFWDHETYDSNDGAQGIMLSEFNVFNCATGYSYAEFGAQEMCSVITKNDTIEIRYLEYLPAGKNWEWEWVFIAKQQLLPDGDTLIITELETCYEDHMYDKKVVELFLNQVVREKGFAENWEDEIGKLEVLSLSGYQGAMEILFSYEQVKGIRTDGAMAEMWKDAVATVKWVRKLN